MFDISINPEDSQQLLFNVAIIFFFLYYSYHITKYYFD